MKRIVEVTISVEVDADLLDPEASSPAEWDWRHAHLTQRMSSVAPSVVEVLGHGRPIDARLEVGPAFDPNVEPF